MDIFSLASNLHQIALGSVNFVNKKLKKNNCFNDYNYISYIIIGENETQPYEMNIFFLNFCNFEKIRFKEFKEFFPFKGNIIFRFKISLKDLIDIINEGFKNNYPLLILNEEEKIKENKNINKNENENENMNEYIISDENYIKKITKQDNIQYVWIDINNDKAYIPLYNGKIFAKVLFINNENYKSYNEIYFKEYVNDNYKFIYKLNDKYLYSYININEETSVDDKHIEKKNRENNINLNNIKIKVNKYDSFKNIDKNENNKSTLKTSLYNEHMKKKNEKISNKIEHNDIKKRENNENLIMTDSLSMINNMCNSENSLNQTNESEYFFESEKISEEKISEYEFNKNNFENDEKNKENLNSKKKKNEINYKEQVNHRLKEIKENRHKEQIKNKEKVLISNNIKKQIDKWSKNSDDTYKDIKVMLSTLNEVIFENAEWKAVSMSDLISNPKLVNKTYKKAIILFHPDRNRDKSVHDMLKAELIFQALNDAYKSKNM